MAIWRDRNWRSGLLGVFSIIGVLAHVIFCSENYALAQITPDGTLGDNSSKLTPNVNIKGSVAERIDGGATRGANLFHSFRDFNVGELQRVYFANPTGIENILTRVTGSNVSKILGTLGVDGGANLFFLNPNGILFGNNARLDVAGSFVASTANSFVFRDGLEFSATNPQTPSPLLTVNPSALFFNQLQAGRIENRSIALAGDNLFGLRVPDGRSLLLVGGDIAIDRGGLNAPGGRVELAGVAGDGTVGLNVDGSNLSLSIPETVARADISLSNQALVSTSGEGGGAIQMWGKRVTVNGGSKIEASTLGALTGKGLSVNAWESVQVIGESPTGIRSGLFAETFGTGDAGDLTINTRQLQILAGGKISAGTKNAGAAGDLTVNASESVQVAGLTDSGEFGSDLFSQSSPTATGKGGNLTINTKQVLVQDGGQVSVSTSNKGAAGNLTVNASESVQVIGIKDTVTGIFAQSEGVGDAGKLTINTKHLFIKDEAGVVADNTGDLVGGSIIINASDSVQLVGFVTDPRPLSDQNPVASGIYARTFGKGQAGDITINTKQLLIQNGAWVSASTYRSGRGGSVTVNASESVQLVGTAPLPLTSGDWFVPSSINALALDFRTGKAGNITINTRQLLIQDGAQVSVEPTDSPEIGGSVIVNASELVQLIGSGTFPRASSVYASSINARTFGKAQAGDITINTQQLLIQDGARISASTLGSGQGGNLKVNASKSVHLIGTSPNGRLDSGLLAETRGTGNAGELTINTGELLIQDRAIVSASTSGGVGGNITVNANTFEATKGGRLRTNTSGKSDAGNITLKVKDSINLAGNGSGLFANTTPSSTGKGGNISIDPGIMTIQDGAKIAVDSDGSGIGGNIELAAGTLTLDKGTISAETSSNTGGNITLNLQDLLLLRNGSQITTTAGNQKSPGDGGNITINTPFIVAVPKENSDIKADAYSGKGGRVDIKTNSIFGIAVQESQTKFSDITADSELGVSGEVTINTPDTDPARGLIQLPSNLVDASQQIASGCTPGGRQTASRFIATGRGGLPLSPNEPLRGRAVMTAWVDLPPQATQRVTDKLSVEITDKKTTASVTKPTNQIVEAQGWIVDGNGDVILVAKSPQSSSIPSAMSCSQ